jgi:hypothetical protein
VSDWQRPLACRAYQSQNWLGSMASTRTCCSPVGTIEIRIGRAVVKVDGLVDGLVDADMLRIVLDSLRS